jgi:hypothetical protein
MNQEFNKKLEDMLVVPFMVILYSCILVPLGILCYQGYLWLKTEEWTGLSLINLTELLSIDLSAMYEPGWTGVKNVVVSFLEWPLSVSSSLLIFISGWLVVLIFCVIAELASKPDVELNNDQEDWR